MHNQISSFLFVWGYYMWEVGCGVGVADADADAAETYHRKRNKKKHQIPGPRLYWNDMCEMFLFNDVKK